MSLVETLKLVGQGGFPVLFALLLIGLGYLVLKLGPQIFGAWTTMITAVNDLKTAILSSTNEIKTAVLVASGDASSRAAALTAKVDSMQLTLEALRTKIGISAEDLAALAVAATGSHKIVSPEEADRLDRVDRKPGQYTSVDKDRRR